MKVNQPMKRIIGLLLVLGMVLSFAPMQTRAAEPLAVAVTQPAAGDGTADNPYQITTVGELYWFAGLVNGTLSGVTKNNSANAKLMNNITVNENVIVDGALTSNTDSLMVWTAMGKTVFSSGWFGGSFDGNYKTISGLYVNETGSYRGFIGCLGDGATIKNLTITDSYFTSTSNSLGAFVGTMGLSSAAENPVIENCKLTDSIVSGKSYVGGIVGGGDYGEIISNCHVYNCAITGTGDNVGGIAGSAGDYNNETYIRLCSVNDGSVSGANSVGGILGKGGRLTKTKLSACCNYNTSVAATTKSAGGILGADASCYSCFATAEVSAPSKQGPFCGSGNCYSSAYDSDVYGEAINYASSTAFTTEEILAGVATYYLADKTASNTVYVLWGQRIGEDKYPFWNPDSNPDYIVYRKDDTENGGYIYYNGDAAAEYEPNEDGIYEIADRSDWYKFAKKAKDDPAIDGILTANIDFNGVASDKMANYVIGVAGKAYTGTFDGDGYTVSNLPEAPQPLFNIIGSGGELKDLNLSGASVTATDTVSAAGLVYDNLGTISNVTVTDITVSSNMIAAAIVVYNRGTVIGCTASVIDVTGKTAAGGIAGVNDSGHTIENCHVFSGTVKADNADGYDGCAGGICGSSYGGTIKGCSNGADVSSEASRLEVAAGIVGSPAAYNDSSVQIIACSNTGSINGDWAGGISGADSTSCYVNISLCYNEGAITGSTAGGIAACGSFNYDDLIINCYNAGEITAVGTQAMAGGIVGNGANNTVKNCHNYGKVVSANVGAPIAACDIDTWLKGRLVNNYGIEGNVEAPYVSSYYDTSSGEYSTAITVGSSREKFADGTITAKLNEGNSETVWYQYTEYPILEERHMHEWGYTLEGTDTIKAVCTKEDCDLENAYGGSLTITAPTALMYDGTSKDADCTYTDWLPAKVTFAYNEVDRINVTGQAITASVTLGEGENAVTASVSYQITPRTITSSMVTVSPTTATYDGSEKTVTVTVKYDSATILVDAADYEITGTTSATEVSTGSGYAVTVTGKGNYTGTVTKYWKITKNTPSISVSLEGWTYGDAPNTPVISGNTGNGEETVIYTVRSGRNYVPTDASHGAQTEGGVPSYAGTYYLQVTVAETEYYSSATRSVAFVISPREVNAPAFEGLQESYTYDNGNEIQPTFTLKDDLGKEIPAGEYTVTYSDNTEEGTATITVTDNTGGNYVVSGSATFQIVAQSADPALPGYRVYLALNETIDMNLILPDGVAIEGNVISLKYADGTDAPYTLRTTTLGTAIRHSFNANRMSDTITVQIFNGQGEPLTKALTISVRDYARKLLSITDNDVEKAMVIRMLDYGALAQIYSDYNTADLVNNIIGADLRRFIDGYDMGTPESYTADSEDSSDIFHAFLALNHSIDMSIFLNASEIGEGEKLMVTMDGQELSENQYQLITTEDGQIYVRYCFHADRMNQELTVAIVNQATGTARASLSLGIREYAHKTMEAYSEDTTLYAMLIAMLDYGAMAQIYAGTNTDDLANCFVTDTMRQVLISYPWP